MNLSIRPKPHQGKHGNRQRKSRRPGDMPYAVRIGVVVASALIISLAPHNLAAQDLNSAFNGFATDSNEPINIESNSLEVNDVRKTAIFKGNVIAVQGDMEMRTPELEVTYSGRVAGNNGANPGGQGTELTRLRAKKKVLLTSQKNQTAKSDWADFDVKKRIITIGGNVVVSQGDNIMKGERLVIDLNTGRSRFETAANSGTRTRVRGIFHPQKKPGVGKKSSGTRAPAKPIVDGWRATN